MARHDEYAGYWEACRAWRTLEQYISRKPPSRQELDAALATLRKVVEADGVCHGAVGMRTLHAIPIFKRLVEGIQEELDRQGREEKC